MSEVGLLVSVHYKEIGQRFSTMSLSSSVYWQSVPLMCDGFASTVFFPRCWPIAFTKCCCSVQLSYLQAHNKEMKAKGREERTCAGVCL